MSLSLKNFTEDEHEVWKTLYKKQENSRKTMIIPEFSAGLQALGIFEDRIPDLPSVNEKLHRISGFKAVPVDGYEETDVFFARIARREFPVGNFIRDKQDLNYTPAPDVFHDLYGHVPFLAWPEYADFVQRFGERAYEHRHDPKILREFDRLFWFTIEFGLIETRQGVKIFGAGIASSYGECIYALSDEPQKIPFDWDTARQQEFRIDIMQPILFVLKSTEQLFN